MKKSYINGLSCISMQPTFSDDFPSQVVENTIDNIRYAVEPSYKEYISPSVIRRMAKGVKMGTAVAYKALHDAQEVNPSAILVGTGMGCIKDSEKFLASIIDNAEQHLTPTSFIQSTHNTLAGQIALNMQCKGMNFTYVNGAVSFESALLEAKMQIEQDLQQNILVGAVDEIGDYMYLWYELVGIIKDKKESPYSIYSDTKGVVFSEGATFFIISGEKSAKTYACLTDITFQNRLKSNEIENFVKQFLQRNNLSISDIDIGISGRNGDCQDAIYYDCYENMFPEKIITYKQYSGEYYTASAFGMWVACHILKNQCIPTIFRQELCVDMPYKHILLYNQFQGKDHSLTLLSYA